MKNPRQHLLRSKGGGGSKKVLFPLFLGQRGPSKKHACFLEGAAWDFSWLDPLDPHLIELYFALSRFSERPIFMRFRVGCIFACSFFALRGGLPLRPFWHWGIWEKKQDLQRKNTWNTSAWEERFFTPTPSDRQALPWGPESWKNHSRLNFSISLENCNIASNFQSRPSGFWSFILVYSLLFSFILFSSLWTKKVVKPLNSKKKSWWGRGAALRKNTIKQRASDTPALNLESTGRICTP